MGTSSPERSCERPKSLGQYPGEVGVRDGKRGDADVALRPPSRGGLATSTLAFSGAKLIGVTTGLKAGLWGGLGGCSGKMLATMGCGFVKFTRVGLTGREKSATPPGPSNDLFVFADARCSPTKSVKGGVRGGATNVSALGLCVGGILDVASKADDGTRRCADCCARNEVAT
jgi:hypothetical protein